MNRRKRNIAIVTAVILAIPTVNFISALVVFPIAIYALFAIVANFAPLVFVPLAAAGRLEASTLGGKLMEKWQYFSIMWLGCSFGISRWGDAAASMGGQNTDYLKVLFAPWFYLFGVPVF
ncbi:hypothetical protein [Roseovarius rhodophyticola]|uniref:Uncharacterized protein n=1 Tax=Roseovarius rhodophyticola TaxID=3080827 RepID=A0ABZ2TD50_9RHOB|nr:hypothetical protein [Roseovarius sp. W115]MDV2931349.1 hypothetical protein [Roseovarius sp. W115]